MGSSSSRIGRRSSTVVMSNMRCFCPPDISVMPLWSRSCSRPSLSNSASISLSDGLRDWLALNSNGASIISRIVL